MARKQTKKSATIPESAKTAPEIPNQAIREDSSKTADESQDKTVVSKPIEVPEPVADQGEPSIPESTTELSPGDRTAEIEDDETAKAVDDIAAREADTMLAVQDALGRKHSQQPPSGWRVRLKKLLRNKWTWLSLLAIILLLLVIPVTRYKIIGLFIKKSVSVTVVDSTTATPVSYATISAHGRSAKTNANGVATLQTAPGRTNLTVSKRYYKMYTKSLFVGLSKTTKTNVKLVATGRQVPLTVLNKFTGQPLANAQITALKTTVKTDTHGRAVIVLPATQATAHAVISLHGYNLLKIDIQVTNNTVSSNSFSLVPTGHIYFLSNVGGGMNVVKTNLDGSSQQTVLAATGQEDSTSISLLATQDWRYLVLKSRRDTAQPALYLIDTSNDKVTPFDSNNGSFNLIGWSGHNFMYDFVSNTTPQSQSGHEIIKSYDADHLQLNQLDQSQAQDGAGGYVAQDFYNFSVLNNQLAYNTQWFSGGGDLTGKNATIRAIQPDGQNKKDYQTFPSAGLNYVLTALYQPQAVYYDAYNGATGQTYYNFANQTVNTVSLDQSYFRRSYPTYLLSPSGNQTFWTDQSGNIFVGDKNAGHPKQLNGVDGYKAYGWFSDNYVLLSKNGTDLYILPAAGLKPGQTPSKIGYYYQPVTLYQNYGYGYGGL